MKRLSIVLARAVSALTVALALEPSVVRAELPTEPILRIEIGMHVDQIKDVAFSPDGLRMATVSDDKTARLWELATGELIDTFRVPIGPGEEGLLFTAAFRPDGKFLLAGGISGVLADGKNKLNFFEAASGDLKLQAPVSGVVNKIAFYPKTGETKYLAIAYSTTDERGVLVINSQGKRAMLDDQYNGAPTWVEFGPDGQLVAVAEDGFIRLYSPEMELIGRQKLPLDDPKPSAARFTPKGSFVAVGYYNARAVDIISARDLSLVSRMPLTLTDGSASVNAVAWLPVEGAYPELYIGGGLSLPDGRHVVRRWRDFRNPNDFDDVVVSRDAVSVLEATPNGEVVFAAADPAWGVISPDGSLRYDNRDIGPDNRDIYNGLFQISSDGSELEFQFAGKGDISQPRAEVKQLRFDAGALTVEQIDGPSQLADGWVAPSPPLGLENWRNNASPTLNGRPISLADDELARSAHQTADGRILLGADFTLYLLDLSGRVIRSIPLDSAAFGVLATASGDRAVIALADGSFRWLSLEPGSELRPIGSFYYTEDDRWVSWLPDGQFGHSSNGGEDLVGYHVNQGPREAARWIELGRLYRRYHQPSAIRGVLGRDAVAATRALGRPVDTSAPELVAQRTPPEVVVSELCYTPPGAAEVCVPGADLRPGTRGLDRPADNQPSDQPTVASGSVFPLPVGVDTVKVTLEAQLFGELNSWDVYLNERTTKQDTRGLDRPDAVDNQARSETLIRDVKVHEGLNVIYGRVWDDLDVEGESLPIVISATPHTEEEKRVVLHALLVGINAYSNPGVPPLRAAVSDAKQFETILREKRSNEYDDVNLKVLVDEEATREGILAAMAELAEEVDTNDSVIVYFAGHGIMQSAEEIYTFVTFDGQYSEEQRIFTGLTQEDLKEGLGAISSRQLFLTLDTCHAGAFEPTLLTGAMRNETGFYVLAASSDVQTALDQRDGSDFGLVMTAFTETAELYGTFRGAEVYDLGNETQTLIARWAEEQRHDQAARFDFESKNAGRFFVTVGDRP